MARIRKDSAGSDSFGHVWDKDGAVVEIKDPEQIAALMAIPDGGFSEVTPGAPKAEPKPAKTDPVPDEDTEVSEIDPDAPAGEPDDKPAPRKPAAKRPGRKPTSAADVQE
jgi:hypothetical protein